LEGKHLKGVTSLKKKTYTIFSILLTFVMIFGLLVPGVTAESDDCSGPKVEPVYVGGNPPEGEKIDPPQSGFFSIRDAGNTVTYYVYYDVYDGGKKIELEN
jgi:hypothetical protein